MTLYWPRTPVPRVLPRRTSWPASCCSWRAVCSATCPSQVPSLSRSRKPPRWPREHVCRATPGSASTRPSTKPGMVSDGWSSSEPRSMTRWIAGSYDHRLGPRYTLVCRIARSGCGLLICGSVLLGTVLELVGQVLLDEGQEPALGEVEASAGGQRVHHDPGDQQGCPVLGEVRVADRLGAVGDEHAAGPDHLELAAASNDRRGVLVDADAEQPWGTTHHGQQPGVSVALREVLVHHDVGEQPEAGR